MESNQKKSLADLFKNKQFIYTLPVLLLVVGGLGYMAMKPADEPVTEKSVLNTTVPTANADTLTGNKLDMQQRGLPEGGDGQSGFLTEVPGSLEQYVYRGGGGRRPAISGLTRYDTTVRSGGSKASSGGLPRSLRTGGNRGDIPLRESDILLSENAGSSPRRDVVANNDELLRKKQEMEKVMADRQKLVTLLEEYKKDKINKQLVDGDKQVVSKAEPAGVVASLNGTSKVGNGFYGLYAEDVKKVNQVQLEKETGTIRALVYGEQEVVNQGRVKMRLLEPVTVRGVVIPANSLIYGTGSFGSERVLVKINSINFENYILPVTMTVYDIDGMAGIYVPNVSGLTEARGAISQGMSGVNIQAGGISANPTAMIGASAAGAALQGARQLVQKKATVQKAILKSDYYVLLRSVSTNAAPETN